MIDLTFNVQCPYCCDSVTGSCEDYVVDTTCYDSEMGSEIEYTIECESYKCPNCDKHFALSGSIWEYPEGCENLNKITAKSIDDETEDE